MSMVPDHREEASGGFKELLLLFFPIAITTFSNCLFLLVEKLFLARLSPLDMEAAVNAAYALQIFQGPCIALTMMAQVYVGRCWGSKELQQIGSGVWQFIWFSLLSNLITIPFGYLYGYFYFKNTEMESVVMPYYCLLLAISFLFPLTISLTSFYIARGRTRLVLCISLAAQCTKIMLAYLLIFGWTPFFSGLGLIGGALSTLIAQGGLCAVLLIVFLKRSHANLFGSWEWRLKPKLFWECTRSGFYRAVCRVLTFLCWASVAHLMSVRGGDSLLFLSIGGTLFLLFTFLSDAVCQAQIVVVSQLLGSCRINLLDRAFHSGTILVLITLALFAIPFVLFPQITFDYLFGDMVVEEFMLRKIFLGVWLCFAFFTFSFVPLSHSLAFKDTQFFLFMGFFNWINGFLLMYTAIEIINIHAENFWLALSLMHGSSAIIYYLRMRWLHAKAADTKTLAQHG